LILDFFGYGLYTGTFNGTGFCIGKKVYLTTGIVSKKIGLSIIVYNYKISLNELANHTLSLHTSDETYSKNSFYRTMRNESEN
jgi:hypothetical protein